VPGVHREVGRSLLALRAGGLVEIEASRARLQPGDLVRLATAESD
jgi:hypothetical protein